MSEITSIETQAKDKTRCNIYVDGRFYCGIKLEVAVKYHLKQGMHIEKCQLDEIQFETEKQQALEKAMAHLSASIKTSAQIKSFLVKKGYTRAVIEYVMEKLEYYNLVNDIAYCRTYVESVRGRGKRLIEADLIKRGAERGAIEKVLNEMDEDPNEALEILGKYLCGKEHDVKNLSKAYRYLLSKGYSSDSAKYALSKLEDINEDY